MTSYERIRVEGKTLYLRNPVEITMFGTACLSGIEVDRNGDEVSGRDWDQRQQIIQLDLITKRTPVVESRTYGWLVTPRQAAQERS